MKFKCLVRLKKRNIYQHAFRHKMSRRESKVEHFNGFDTEFSSGDSNKTPKSKQNYIEENNNEIDELSKDFNEMGCIVDSVKRPPNICVETCVFAESSTESEDEFDKSKTEENVEENYSDEFEEDKSDIEGKAEVPLENGEKEESPQPPCLPLKQSHSFTSSKQAPSVGGKSSTAGSSITSQRMRRVNMSFSNERLREIERHNHILLNKILSARNTRKSSIPVPQDEPKRPLPAAALQRKKLQQQIDHDNMILLKKIQRVKSSSFSFRR